MASREHWVENLCCPQCGKTGPDSFDIRVDSVPEGFRVIESLHAITFYCSSCDVPVDPQ
jgi:hypothetical protein